ncbi:hypothetical protein [Burkholderia stagnalis]|uniref:hypothetical protein n=1 Tax=Burkholderia stagnalis TaxID=1503054 RepID=UPI000A65C46A|nr:hypothetical protein [Burkholderia stagnalis]
MSEGINPADEVRKVKARTDWTVRQLAIDYREKVLSTFAASTQLSYCRYFKRGENGMGSCRFGLSDLPPAIYLLGSTALSASTQNSSYASLSISSIVSPNGRSCSGNISIGSSGTNASLQAQVSGSATGIGARLVAGISSVANGAAQAPFSNLPLPTAQVLYYQDVANLETASFVIAINGYTS